MEKNSSPEGEKNTPNEGEGNKVVVDTKAAEEAKRKSEEIQQKIDKIQELLKDVDISVLSDEAKKALDTVSALRKEKRRLDEMIAQKRSEGIKEIVFERARKLGIEDEDELNRIFEKLKDSKLDIDDNEKVDAEIRKIVPSLHPEEFWKMKEQLIKQKEMTDKNVQANVNAASPDTTPNQEEYSEEVLKYAQEHGIKPERAKKILEKFSTPSRRIM